MATLNKLVANTINESWTCQKVSLSLSQFYIIQWIHYPSSILYSGYIIPVLYYTVDTLSQFYIIQWIHYHRWRVFITPFTEMSV